MRRATRAFRRSRLGGASSLIVALTLAGGAALVLKPKGRSLEGRAFAVDGDTIRIDDTRIRIKGIDAPEMQQSCSRSGRSYACGDTARRTLIALITGQAVRCRASGRDRYQRVLAVCTVEGRDVGARMVEAGWAVTYGRDYSREEASARSRAAGLWSGEFERPQEWRRERSARD